MLWSQQKETYFTSYNRNVRSCFIYKYVKTALVVKKK